MSRPLAGRWFLVGAIAIVAIGVRLIALNQPFIDAWSWRQTDVAAIARNYLQTGFRFAYPQIDWSGPTAGYVGTEFPILPFAAALSYKAVGIHEWVGRLQSLLFFAFSLPFLFALVKGTFGETAALWALVFYTLAPLSLMTSRCFMPDMPSLSLSLAGLFFFTRWLDTESRLLFSASAAAVSLALLIKLPSAIIGAPVAVLAFEHFGRRTFRRPALWLFAALVLAPSLFWYWHAANVARSFYPHHFFGGGGVRLMSANWYWEILRRTITSSLTIALSIFAAAGLFAGLKRDRSLVFHGWLAAMVLFVVVVGYGNRHPWYQLPLVPIAAAFAGRGIDRLLGLLRPRRLTVPAMVIIVFLFATESVNVARQLYRPAAADLRKLGLALKQQTAPSSVIVVADFGDPTALYYAERKGWHFTEKGGIYNGHPTTSADAIADLEYLRQQGATHIAFYSGSAWWLDYYDEFAAHLRRNSVPVEMNATYEIFQLKR